ncbi:hypothetical protein SAMN05421507_1232 [Lentzea jiangxiensis]|uniref:Uncharacterized protein n=1 Tax=Lentzea jiangxiensis TaxID=641025 RepID=A0A1H0WTB4_9PSEU|nr:hypothetical protein SAMN05421507_1232 [Lentzea jiangxiensis]
MFDQQVLGWRGRVFPKTERLGDRRRQSVLAFAQIRQRDAAALDVADATHLVDEAFCNSGFADTTRADEGEHTCRGEGIGTVLKQLTATDEAAEFAR